MKVSALVALALCSACSAAPIPPAGRALCYVVADRNAQARVDAECRIGDAGVDISECPARDDILAELKADLGACK